MPSEIGFNSWEAASVAQTTASGTRAAEAASARQNSPREEIIAAGEAAGKHVDSELRQVVERLNRYAEIFRRDLAFTVDEESGMRVIRVLRPDTGEVVRQIPPEEALAIAQHLAQSGDLQLFGRKA